MTGGAASLVVAVCACGSQVELAGALQRHQVFEVPPLRAQVDEYRINSGRCTGCGKPHAGVLPPGVPKGQLGPHGLSLVGVLGTRYHLTQRKIHNLLDQLMGLSFSAGAISQAHGKVAVALKAPLAEAAASLCTAAVTSDRYAGYAFIDVERRQVCWTHLLRDFNRIGQRHGLAGQLGRRLLGLGLVMFRKRDMGQLEGGTLEGLKRRKRQTLERGAEQGQCSRTANTCTNILKLWPALGPFTTHDALVPTNNSAEQALRSLVLKRKISGPTRSLRGDQFLARGFTVHETCLRQGVDVWDFMHKAVHVCIAKTAPPSLMPRNSSVAVAPTG